MLCNQAVDLGDALVEPRCRLLDALGVHHESHATHHAWVKGGVESANYIVERQFESRLREEPVEDVRQLMGASTPHFALQLRDRLARLIASLPAGDPVRFFAG